MLDLALPELLDGASVTLIEWGDAIIPALPGEYLEVRLEYGDDDDERVIGVRPVGHRWLSREIELKQTLEGTEGGSTLARNSGLMLILGIESASTQVGCAIGGHEGVLASIHSSGVSATPRC